MSGPGTDATEVGTPAPSFSRGYVRLVVALLTLAVFVEFLHRQILAVAQNAIGKDLGVSDTALGALVTVFALAYGVAAPLLGRLADRGSRRAVYGWGIAVWSAATAAAFFVPSFLALLATRIVAGAAQGSAGATNTPLLVDYVTPDRRGGAVAIVTMGATLAAVGAGALGALGVLEAVGWRGLFLGTGAAGVGFALAFAWLVQEPPRGWSEGRSAAAPVSVPLREALAVVGARKTVLHAFTGMVINNVAVFASAQWIVTFYERSHRVSNARASLALAAIAVASTVGAIAGGVLTNRAWTPRPRAVLLIPGACAALAFPLMLGALFAASFSRSVALLSVGAMLALVHGAPCVAVIQALIPDRVRSFVSGMISSVLTVVGLGLGPLVAGALSDVLGGAPTTIGRALALVSALYLWAALHFLLATRTLIPDLAASAEADLAPARG